MASVRLNTTLMNGVPDYAWDTLMQFELPIKDSTPEYFYINLYPVIREMERTGNEENRRAAREWKFYAAGNSGVLRIHRSHCTPL